MRPVYFLCFFLKYHVIFSDNKREESYGYHVPNDENDLVVCEAADILYTVNEAVHAGRVYNGIKDVVGGITSVLVICLVLCNIIAEEGVHADRLKLTVTACGEGLVGIHVRALTCANLVVGEKFDNILTYNVNKRKCKKENKIKIIYFMLNII